MPLRPLILGALILTSCRPTPQPPADPRPPVAEPLPPCPPSAGAVVPVQPDTLVCVPAPVTPDTVVA